ncbi:MAG: TlpA family protein disulfide reductase [Odoribacteraceae bacterium]|jgi:thiol-disulfide isomerase/thioredoxin|nr:TlpA family protein disulfide reductase [Odoribacteraceae bacterium]
MKRIYLLTITFLLIAAPALQAQETKGTRTWSAEEIARFKQVKVTTVPRTAGGKVTNGQVDLETLRQAVASPLQGEPSPALNAEDITGTAVTLENFRGKYVLIDVWATWCGPCRAEIPSLKAMEEELAGRDIAFVSISVDENKEAWSKMVKDDDMTGYQLWIGQNHEFSSAYGINGIPRFILLDKEGNIINGNINRRPSGRDLLPTLEALLDGTIDHPTAIDYLKNGFPRESMVGKPSPAFAYPDIDGRELSLPDLRGKYVMVDLWATWCGFCVQEIPHMKTLEQKMHGRNIAFVSISVDADKAKWEAYVKEQQMTGTQLYAGDDKSFTAPYDVNGIPRFILIDREGNVLDPNMKLRPSNPDLLPFLEQLDGI